MPSFTNKIVILAVIFTLITFIASAVIFQSYLFSVEWFIGSMAFIILFYNLVKNKMFSWHQIDNRSFKKKLFQSSFIIRLVGLLIIIIIAEIKTGNPFYVGAADALKYHRVAMENVALINNSNWSGILTNLSIEYPAIDDYGFPLFLTSLYLLTFKSIFLSKLILIIISSYTVVQGYKLTRLIWDEDTARFAGLILMAFPLSLFYSGIYLKANLITFLVINISYFVTKAFTFNNFSLKSFTVIILQVLLFFFLRTAIGALMIMLILGAFFINYYKGSKVLSIFVGIILSIVFIGILNFLGLTEIYLERISSAASGFGEAKLQNVQDVNKWAQIGSIPIFILISIFAPFPTLVNYEGIAHGPFNYYIPGLMVWNFIGLFVLYGLIHVIHKFRKTGIMLWGFALGYTYILIDTALFTSTRFSYSTMPILLIIAAVGYRKTNSIRFWRLYLIIIGAVIIGWNYFKLGGRGLI